MKSLSQAIVIQKEGIYKVLLCKRRKSFQERCYIKIGLLCDRTVILIKIGTALEGGWGGGRGGGGGNNFHLERTVPVMVLLFSDMSTAPWGKTYSRNRSVVSAVS